MPLRLGTPLPELSGATEWINATPNPGDLPGTPLLVYFWSISCPVCVESLPKIEAWHVRYAPHGLQIIAIHVPRQESDTDVARVRELVTTTGLTVPCGIDSHHAVMAAYENEFVPAYFLFDGAGKLVGRAGGYNGSKLIEAPLLRIMEADTTVDVPLPRE